MADQETTGAMSQRNQHPISLDLLLHRS